MKQPAKQQPMEASGTLGKERDIVGWTVVVPVTSRRRSSQGRSVGPVGKESETRAGHRLAAETLARTLAGTGGSTGTTSTEGPRDPQIPHGWKERVLWWGFVCPSSFKLPSSEPPSTLGFRFPHRRSCPAAALITLAFRASHGEYCSHQVLPVAQAFCRLDPNLDVLEHFMRCCCPRLLCRTCGDVGPRDPPGKPRGMGSIHT
ncbi:hypothetical protein M8818_005986 [Zalaria obscura]|uniref:Uncharacterized protein n=1 Tax=Zalaria obscura TaxID=2024903 RepID=A0ACC3S767_9PEZI